MSHTELTEKELIELATLLSKNPLVTLYIKIASMVNASRKEPAVEPPVRHDGMAPVPLS